MTSRVIRALVEQVLDAMEDARISLARDQLQEAREYLTSAALLHDQWAALLRYEEAGGSWAERVVHECIGNDIHTMQGIVSEHLDIPQQVIPPHPVGRSTAESD